MSFKTTYVRIFYGLVSVNANKYKLYPMKKKILLFPLFFLVFFTFTNQAALANEKAAGSSAVLEKPVDKYAQDARVKVLKEYLASYNSPLANNAETFVKQADIYQLDWKLVAAISGVESTFAHQIPYNTNNAWGWGIHGDNMIYFDSYDEAIETISKSLRKNYMNKWGAQDVYQIGKFYAASPTWAQRVDYFMNQIDAYALRNPSTTQSYLIE